MHSKSFGRALLLTALAALIPGAGAALAQGGPGEPQNFGEDYAPADPVWPFPLYSTHPENGGFFAGFEFVSYRQTNTLQNQVVAQRGFEVSTPVLAFQNSTAQNFTRPFVPGVFVGSGTDALDVSQVRGPTDFTPGWALNLGWKFGDGSALTFRWLFITEVNIHANATLVPPGGNPGADFAESFLFSPVFNFPNDYAGPVNKLAVPNPTFTQGSTTQLPFVPAPGLAYGIWNGASLETEQFLQRTQQFELTYRAPMFETEDYRVSGIVGPRYTWMWERYLWRASSLDINGAGAPEWTAQYTNVVDNRMYGVHAGFEQECYIGHGFAADVVLQGALYADSTKTEVKYSLARGANGFDHPGPVSKRSRQNWRVVPELQATGELMWYPIEGIEIRAGYDVQSFFNTISSHQPIDFNYGAVDPRFEYNTVRFLDGFNIGIGFMF